MFYLWLSICLCVSLLWVCGCICISLCSSLALIFLFSWSSPFPTPSSPQETRMVIYTGFHINCWKYHPEPGLEYVCSGRLTLTGVLDPHPDPLWPDILAPMSPWGISCRVAGLSVPDGQVPRTGQGHGHWFPMVACQCSHLSVVCVLVCLRARREKEKLLDLTVKKKKKKNLVKRKK